MIRKVLVCAAALSVATAVACSKSSPAPASPSVTPSGDAGAAADGSTLKASAPTAVSPINGAQPDTVVLIATRATGTFSTVSPSYEFEVFSGSTRVYTSGVITGDANGNNVSVTPAANTFDFDQ